MKINLPTPVVIGIVVLVVAVIGFFFIRGVTVEAPTPRPDPASFGEKPGGAKAGGTSPGGANSYPGQSGSGAVTPINPSGG